MPTVYIIAGPPGIGKSTSGASMVPDYINILDPDQIADRYKKQGFASYKDIGNFKFDELLRKELFSGQDFAVELNLGFESHYDLLRSIKNFSPENSIHVILFYTDNINLCYQRAKERHLAGLHLVAPEIIKEMYHNTLPLLQANIGMVNTLSVLNITGELVPKICLHYERLDNKLTVTKDSPSWAKTSIIDYIETTNKKAQALNPTLKVSPLKVQRRNGPKL